MAEKRDLIRNSICRKGPDMHALFVARISGDDISGEVFQYEIWLNNQEQVEHRVTSGNKYEVRRALHRKLLDLREDGWSCREGGVFGAGSPDASFFDLGGL